ncbi:hypothetical protein C2857_005389 [Epichloe festucae Fl1]|uniref:Uncharacterized protein n=1 Tax=Epichloe festucae (strain Fl1) TaxID=877507 RepID=A0A7S9PVI7_EPIFF|nr:hypothetical protein C2857_005389 [Epichloe festucae Fl1]
MATHSTASIGHDGRPDDLGPTPLPYRPQPGSPTLTNPDMILPDYDESEPFEDRSHLPLPMWKNDQPSDAFHDFSPTGYMSGPLPPNTPIIYGNGTMLSDIGEVTEVESTVGCQPSRNSSRTSDTGLSTGGSGTPLRSSPTMGKKTLKKRPRITKRERRLSIESTSTIQTIEVPDETFGDLDDSVSVDDSSFQGDDEESLASEVVDEKSVQIRDATVLPSDQTLNEDSLSTESISARAEQILANAKRRLTAMEGNLNRARTFSYSSVSDGSTPSPGDARSNGLSNGRIQSITPSHSRNVSDNGLPGAARTNMLPQRSASALGAAGGYRQQLTLSRSADALGAKSSLGSLRSPLHTIDSVLEPLDENEDAEDEVQSRSGSRLWSFASPTFGSYGDAGLTRSASVAQMRDLQDQMQGLKGKISSLREQAKQDSMKRRSLQSLRALSPFTNAPHDPESTSPKPTASPEPGSTAASQPLNGTNTSLENKKTEVQGENWQSPTAGNEKQAGSIAAQSHEVGDSQLPELGEESHYSNGGHQEEQRQFHGEKLDVEEVTSTVQTNDKESEVDPEDNISESGESLYHDTHQEPVDISHEDRKDAFDYEHFFLHSAMGTMTRQGMTRSNSFGSEGSEDSVETTRGPTMTYVRRPSIDTMTSIDSFATARERAGSRSSTVQSSRMDDVFTTPTAQYENSSSSSSSSSTTTKRSTVGGLSQRSGSGSGSVSTGYYQKHARHDKVIHRPVNSTTDTTLHRPSVSSFESTGTNRSFPLVNKAHLSGGSLTPSGSPEYQLKQVAESLMNETASICDKDSAGSGPNSPAIQTLSREDQLLVEQVVASLGRCVLGLSEATRQGAGNHDHYRRRIEAARKLLENVSDRASSNS